jgi:hypothetical protein
MPKIQLSPKQNLALQLLNDPLVVELLFGGGAGGGKSLLVTLWMVIQCRMYPGITIGLARKEISNLGKTTVVTLLTKTHPLLGVTQADFKYTAPGNTNPGIYYSNGSSIILLDLAPKPSDPEYDGFGSLELTHVVFEEVGEIVAKAQSALNSRKNRMMNKEYGLTGKTVLTCNPSQNFIRDDFYEPYLKLGGGDYQIWDHGLVEVEGQMLPAKRAFVRSLPTDNPFISRNYLETLRNLPDAQRRRLMEGDWDFDTEQGKLVASHHLKQTDEFDRDARSFFGCDPSRGGDGCLFTELKGTVVVDAFKLLIPDDEHLDIGTFVAEAFIAWVQERGGGYDVAAVDVVGIGSSVLDACNRLDFYVQAFNAGSTKGIRGLDPYGNIIDRPEADDKTIPLFNNVRSQYYSDMGDAIKKGELLWLRTVQYFHEFKRDFSSHMIEYKERQTIVESKIKMKSRLGRSPDYSDSLLAAWWCRSNAPEHFHYDDNPTDTSSNDGYGSNSDSPITSGLLNSRF